MLENASEIRGLEVYGPDGVFIGVADELILDILKMRVHGIFVQEANPARVEEGLSISIPMRWVRSVGDIIILNSFPGYVAGPGS
ncbi:MAG: PRC-barrel domain-containing protein [Candidatus Methanoplasma sp.]|jgi:sporulation protein YlmC with PRC-barrel domain|nr:PRC-barrel domain-containing protein [Candidatus Methanoplasma sp.]